MDRVRGWAATRSDVHAVALVGSWARRDASADSDVDLVFLVDEPDAYLTDEAWASDLGASSMLRTRSWGAVTERRFSLSSGLEVDVGIASVSWASVAPVDAGTDRVVADGLEIVYDPEGVLAALTEATSRGTSEVGAHRPQCARAALPRAVETERLLLRPLTIADIDEFVALHDDPEVTRFTRRLERPEAEERLRRIEREWLERDHGIFAVLDRAGGRFLGRAGLKYWPQFDETEVGWVLRRDAWGRGYATEAARACIDWAFSSLDLPYLTAMIHPENDASIRVAHRLGMAYLRSDALFGEPVVVFSLSREDWSRGEEEER